MIIGEALFRKADLSAYLRQQVDAIGPHVRHNVNSGDLAKTDEELAAAMLPQALVAPIVIDFNNPTKDVVEAQVTVNDLFSGRVQVSGVRVTKSFTFEGDRRLLDMRPSGWSNSPRATVGGNRIILGYEGRNEPQTIKDELEREESSLREYVATSTRDIEAHNAKLPAMLKEAVAARRKQLIDIDNLKNAL